MHVGNNSFYHTSLLLCWVTLVLLVEILILKEACFHCPWSFACFALPLCWEQLFLQVTDQKPIFWHFTSSSVMAWTAKQQLQGQQGQTKEVWVKSCFMSNILGRILGFSSKTIRAYFNIIFFFFFFLNANLFNCIHHRSIMYVKSRCIVTFLVQTQPLSLLTRGASE